MNDEVLNAPLSDEELTELALSADPNPAIDPGVSPWRPVAGAGAALLPEWYMPAPSSSGRGTGTRAAVGLIVAGFVLINALGLCITYGYLTWA